MKYRIREALVSGDLTALRWKGGCKHRSALADEAASRDTTNDSLKWIHRNQHDTFHRRNGGLLGYCWFFGGILLRVVVTLAFTLASIIFSAIGVAPIFALLLGCPVALFVCSEFLSVSHLERSCGEKKIAPKCLVHKTSLEFWNRRLTSPAIIPSSWRSGCEGKWSLTLKSRSN